MKVTQMPPVHAATMVANSGNTAYRFGVITLIFAKFKISWYFPPTQEPATVQLIEWRSLW